MSTMAVCLYWTQLRCRLVVAHGPVFGFVDYHWDWIFMDHTAELPLTKTCGPNWPTAGEIDIVEGVNNQAHNQMTLHTGTSNPCSLDVTGSFTGRVLATNCYSTQTANIGCSILDINKRSFGYGFNNAQGGVFALLWDTSAGMSVWHFARADIPADITSQTPTPANWGTPAGHWSSATCDIADNFYDHSMIFDMTICGDWAGNTYGNSGCPGTCSQMVANAANFAGELA